MSKHSPLYTMKKIVVALSGGMDSAAAVLRLRSEGYEPVGLYLDMLRSPQAVVKVKEVAARLGIELLIEDCTELFRRTVTDYFFYSYMRGETPAPCTICNPQIKWSVLAAVADRLGIEKIATGHYSRIACQNEVPYIRRGADPLKDQSYYLWGLNAEILSRAVFPLGQELKRTTRTYLKETGYDIIESQAESMGICFLGAGGYEEYISSQALECGIKIEEGYILDVAGNVVGHHKGIPFYTVGQKRGIGGGLAVIDINATDNTITVGSNERLYTDSFIVKEWVSSNIEELTSSPCVTVMVRGIGRNPDGFAAVIRDGSNLRVNLSSPAWAVASGQPAVFYIGDRVVGGGIIEKMKLQNHL